MKHTSSSLSRPAANRWLLLLFTFFVTVVIFAFLWALTTDFTTATPTGLAQKLLCCGGVSLLLGSLVYILAFECHRERGDAVRERPDWFYPLLSGVLSLCAMCVAYSFLGMWPFGEKSGMTVDMHHQYAPLLAGLRDAILNGDLSTYSFEVGLGTNYVSLFGYYLASPLNLLLVLFPERLLAEGILFITLIKNALSGALFALCVQTVFRHKSLCVPTVSVMYSLMMYLLAYSWNIMWLDVVMVLPLVVLGFERLMHTGKYLTYVLSLAYCLYANYYIGFMLCIFLVLYYGAYVLRSPRTGNQVAVSFGKFAGCSVLAAGLTAVLLIPVYLALQTTSAAGDTLPDIGSARDMFELIGRHLAVTSPTIRSGNLPNIYCGVLTALCVPLFALNKGISLRRRVIYMILWLVMALSFLVNWTDLLWHGLHSPNDLPYRFSFLYSFLLLLMAFETLIHLKHIQLKHVLAVFAGSVTYLVIEERFGDKAYGFEQIYINLLLIGVYAAILAVASRRVVRKRVVQALLLLVVTAEMTFVGANAIVEVNNNEYYTKHTDYVDNTVTEALREAVQKAQQIGDANAEGDFYRMEFLPRRTCVDTALFHYRGITTFSSSNYYTTTKLMGGLGYAINGVNSHLYRSFVPFTDSLLGIRYVILDSADYDYPQLTLLDSATVEETTYYIYENTDALGLGYVADSSIAEYTYTQYNPITSQNQLFTALTGITDDLYTLCPILADDSGGTTSYNDSGFRVNPDRNNGYASFSATAEQDGQLFLFADCNAAESLSVDWGNGSQSIPPHESYIVNSGFVAAGTTVTLTVNTEIACSGNFYVALLNEDVYEKGMAVLAADQLTVSSFSDRHIVGSVNSSKNGAVITSIPYDAGWTVLVDGTPVEIYGVADGFLAFDVTVGSHRVELTYTPKGMTVGLCVSLLSLAVLALLLIWGRVKKHRPAPPSEYLDMDSVRPVQEGFSVASEPMTQPLKIPDTLAELTGETVVPPVADPSTEEPSSEDICPPLSEE